jgi:hypothetical protein
LTPEQAAKYSKRSALAAGSNRVITPANVGDLVRIAKIQSIGGKCHPSFRGKSGSLSVAHVGSPNAANEPIVGLENAANEPTDDGKNVTNEPKIAAESASAQSGERNVGTDARGEAVVSIGISPESVRNGEQAR